MKRLAIVTVAVATLIAARMTPSFASDWDKAGKILAVFEGLRVLTGGRADVIGTVTGINQPQQRQERYDRGRPEARHDNGRYAETYARYRHRVCEQVWVPEYVWVEKYVPRHTEYRPGYGTVIIEGHYESSRVEQGGHWETFYREYD